MPPKVNKCPSDLAKKFQALKLHENVDLEQDNAKRPFIHSATVQEDHKEQLFGCAFNPYAEPEDVQYFATVGKNSIRVYKCPKDVNHILPVFSFSVTVAKKPEKEELFSVTWAYDTYEAEKNRNAYKLVAGGACGQIYVVDFETRELCNILRSFGNEVNDIRTSPVDSNLVASSCQDLSIRIHHIRNESCLLVIGGARGHQGNILSLDWHITGDYLVSSSFDHRVMKWDLSTTAVQNHLKKACDALSKGKQNIFIQTNEGIDDKCLNDDFSNEKQVFKTIFGSEPVKVSEFDVEMEPAAAIRDVANNFSENRNTVYPITIPCGLASDVHDDYVDCVRILPGTDYIISKSTGADTAIRTWRFGPPQTQTMNTDGRPILEATECTTLFNSRNVPNGEPYFLRFAVDPCRRWLVCGSALGFVHFYDLRNFDRDQEPMMTIRCGNDSVRQVSFSTCGRFICTVDDQGLVCRFDRISESVDPTELSKFP
uniref:WD_REPEATS_REGION domain-containing protein n=1 Tax=Caenorhabditis tropicalis TaxID=1561998 RepID=A0A1I7UJ70_9PELO